MNCYLQKKGTYLVIYQCIMVFQTDATSELFQNQQPLYPPCILYGNNVNITAVLKHYVNLEKISGHSSKVNSYLSDNSNLDFERKNVHIVVHL